MRNPSKLHRSPATALLAAASLLAACAASGGEVPKGGSIGQPRGSNGFVSNAQVPGLVIAEARFQPNHAQLFGTEKPGDRFTPTRSRSLDLIEEHRLVPIFVKIGLPSKADSEVDVQLTPEQMDFRLILQDGTVLQAVAPESAVDDEPELATMLGDRALQQGFLKLSGGVKEGYVYFELRPKDAFEYDEGELVHLAGDVRRTLDLSRSLLAFKLARGGQSTPFFIGVGR